MKRHRRILQCNKLYWFRGYRVPPKEGEDNLPVRSYMDTVREVPNDPDAVHKVSDEVRDGEVNDSFSYLLLIPVPNSKTGYRAY